jgi:hypothetical protein
VPGKKNNDSNVTREMDQVDGHIYYAQVMDSEGTSEWVGEKKRKKENQADLEIIITADPAQVSLGILSL